MSQLIIYTIGHSTRTIDEFTHLLTTYQIQTLVDVRQFPGSRKFPQYNKENLPTELAPFNIDYHHILNLGGRRKIHKDSHNTLWHKDAFRSYADYMETNDFIRGINELVEIAKKSRTAFMCSEAVWWRCHRSMISDFLKTNGWKVMHILSDKNLEEHPYTSPARIRDGKLYYYEESGELRE